MKLELEKKDCMRIIPLGGLGAIGNHLTLFEYKDDIIIVDVGIMFPDEEMLGIDYLIPDFSYIVENRNKVKGIIITHGHEDHIGALPFLLQEINAPIYATKLTLGFIQSRLNERPPKGKPTFIEVAPREKINISNFMIDFIRVNHSIVDGVGLAINTDLGTIIHSGDFKIDYSPLDGQVIDISMFAEYGDRGVLLLMSDSTNAVVEGYSRSESSLSKRLIDIFSSSNGRIIVASFASNIHRIQQAIDAARKYNRKVALSGITMEKNFEIAGNLGYLSFNEELIIDIKDVNNYPDKKLVVICSGTQGEPMSALSRMANGTHKHIKIGERDTVIITASIIPGKEKMVNNVVNSLLRDGAEVYYDQEDIHASGHASEEELKLLISLVKPKFFMPIHGEYRHLKAHAKIAESLKIKPSHIVLAENGDVLELTARYFKKAGFMKLSKFFVDGNEIGDIESKVIKERQAMSTDGVIFVSIVMSDGVLQESPRITVKGFIGQKNNKLLEEIENHVEQEATKLIMNSKDEEMNYILKKKLRQFVFKLTRRNPLIEILLLNV